MTRLVVDASVWVAAADRTDPFSGRSRVFLAAVAAGRQRLALPAHTHLEVACALARRLRNPEAGRRLASRILGWPAIEVVPLDTPFLKQAVRQGTELLLRPGDAPYVSVASNIGGPLVAWDEELIQRGNAITPDGWLSEGEGKGKEKAGQGKRME